MFSSHRFCWAWSWNILYKTEVGRFKSTPHPQLFLFFVRMLVDRNVRGTHLLCACHTHYLYKQSCHLFHFVPFLALQSNPIALAKYSEGYLQAELFLTRSQATLAHCLSHFRVQPPQSHSQKAKIRKSAKDHIIFPATDPNPWQEGEQQPWGQSWKNREMLGTGFDGLSPSCEPRCALLLQQPNGSISLGLLHGREQSPHSNSLPAIPAGSAWGRAFQGMESCSVWRENIQLWEGYGSLRITTGAAASVQMWHNGKI